MLHAIVQQMKPSEEQERPILVRDSDVVLTAGAGAGKTRTLVARYLSLLAAGLPLRSIVAITFTRKAAREMRNRTRGQMRSYITISTLDEEERARWQALYGELDAARIGTIHSLCAEILRAHPAEAGIDPFFSVLDEAPIAILRAQVVEEALAWAADQELALPLFALLGESGLRATLRGLLEREAETQEALQALPADPLVGWRAQIEEQQRATLQRLVGSADWRAAAELLAENRPGQPNDALAEQRRLALHALAALAGSLPDALSALAQLAGITLNRGSAKAWPGGTAQREEVKEALKRLRAACGTCQTTWDLHLVAADEQLASALPPLAALYAHAIATYRETKRRSQVLDYDDLERLALQLLHDNAPVRARWQAEVQALLVDEFQDTSGRQRDLLALLRGAQPKLFIVGDAKQSIYRFRGADVTVFRQERQRIAATGGQALALATTYRAHRELVAGLNELLRPILGTEEDASRPWVEPFAALRHHRGQPGAGFAAPYIELHLALGSKSDGALARAADALALRLAQMVEGGTLYVEEEGNARPLRYDDVAILCRSSSSFGTYEDALERAQIPYLTVAGRGFYQRPEVRDVLNALQALDDPGDDLALAGLLRSPVIGLSDAALYTLCTARAGQVAGASLWQVLQRNDLPLGDEDAARRTRAVELIAALSRRVGRSPVADVLKAFLDATDYRAVLLRAGQERGARNLAKLLDDAHASNRVGVGAFLEHVANLRDSGAREGEARSVAEGAVQIMSIHAAKGLEFAIVALGDVGYSARSENGLLCDPQLGVLLPLKDEGQSLPAAYRLGRLRADDQESSESDRLLYVAATRAREKLLISGHVGVGKDGTPAKATGWLQRLVEAVGLELASLRPPSTVADGLVHAAHVKAGDTEIGCTLYEPEWCPTWPVRTPHAPSVSRWQSPHLLDPVQAPDERVDAKQADRERVPLRRVWRVVPAVERPRAPAWVVGQLVHAALANWRLPDGNYAHWAETRARGYGLADARQLADAVSRSRRLLHRFAAHPLYLEMDSAERRLHEVPYSIAVDGTHENGLIDALYLRAGLWTLVEFKTDRVQNEGELAALLERSDYGAQTERYAHAVEQWLGQRPRVLLCLLNYARGVRLLPFEGGHAAEGQ